jgi:1-acyl-sn-glycerol-3-phosphate acyltransferase
MLRFLYKGTATALAVLSYFLVLVPARLLIRDQKNKLLFCTFIMHYTAKVLLFILNIQVTENYRERNRSAAPCLLVANHLSYIDIFIIAAAKRVVFITSREVKEALFLGWITRLGGSLFIERRNFSGLKNEITDIACYLRQGFTVCLFPEATSTDGRRILPFKTAFLEAARIAEVPVLPLCIRFTWINREPIHPLNLDIVCYYGSKTFFMHLARILVLDSIEVDLCFMESIHTHTLPRREIGNKAYTSIVQEYFRGRFACLKPADSRV